ncbi:MAG: hypothetical protein ACXWUG_01815 [Polyangiales bacterium]
MAADTTSLPAPRSLPLRDVRDLALAVIEGAVAAESLAKELRRTPDRSKHFQDIAERLRAVVGRPSIRSALADDGTEHVVLARATAAAPRPSIQTPVERLSGEHAVPEVIGGSPQLDRIEAILQRMPSMRSLDALEARVARIEQLTGRALEGERQVVRSTEEALALVARVVERLKHGTAVSVRLENE